MLMSGFWTVGHPVSGIRGILVTLIVLCLVATDSNLGAQPTPPTWVALDTSPAGTPPTLALDGQASNVNRSVFDLTIHGYYEQRIKEEQTWYRKIWLPHLPARMAVEGRPALPQVPLVLGIPTDAQALNVERIDVLSSLRLTGVRVFPAQPAILEEPNKPVPDPPFTVDKTFYAQTNTAYPAKLSRLVGSPGIFRRVRVQNGFVRPFRCIPAQDVLLIYPKMRVYVTHPGTRLPKLGITAQTDIMFQKRLSNYPLLRSLLARETSCYYAGYLIVTDPDYVTDIEPLKRQKQERGYQVTVLRTDKIGTTATSIRKAIQDWYNGLTNQYDAYVLLVGDTRDIPVHTDPWYSNPSDHYYACMEEDIYPDVGLGRLSGGATPRRTRSSPGSISRSCTTTGTAASQTSSSGRGSPPATTWMTRSRWRRTSPSTCCSVIRRCTSGRKTRGTLWS